MHIAEDPQVSDQSVPKRKERCASPLDLFPCWFEAKKVATVSSRKPHSGKTLVALSNQVKNLALVFTKGLMYEIDVISKLEMPSFTLTERSSECEVWLKQRGNCRLVVLVPYIGIELLNNSFECGIFHGECRGVS